MLSWERTRAELEGPGFSPSAAARGELIGLTRSRLGAVAPKEIEFAPSVPKTRSGEILLHLLGARESIRG